MRAAPAVKEAPSPEKEAPAPTPVAATVTWTTEAEARTAFESLLKEVITRPSMSWKEAAPQLMKDIRYTVADGVVRDVQAIRTAGQRKQIFSEFISRMSKEQRDAKLRKMVENREKFHQMLTEATTLTVKSTYSEIEALLKNDERWNALERGEREREVRQFIQEKQQKEREVRAVERVEA